MSFSRFFLSVTLIASSSSKSSSTKGDVLEGRGVSSNVTFSLAKARFHGSDPKAIRCETTFLTTFQFRPRPGNKPKRAKTATANISNNVTHFHASSPPPLNRRCLPTPHCDTTSTLTPSSPPSSYHHHHHPVTPSPPKPPPQPPPPKGARGFITTNEGALESGRQPGGWAVGLGLAARGVCL
ncbi:hypothetical protein Tco_1459804 [Tanacetum coccineum]